MILCRLKLPLFLGVIFLISGASCASGKTLDKARALSVSQLPITFEQNKGQADPRTQFLAHAGKINLELRPSEVDFSTGAAKGRDSLKLELVGGDQNAPITPLEPVETETNYFPGPDSSQWHTHVPNFKRVRYANLYAGIDLFFYGNGPQLEHDFVIAPSGDYRQIRMGVRGARSLSVEPDGSLKISLQDGSLTFHSPDVYQNSSHGREGRSGRFVLRGRDEAGFEVGNYDHTRPLVIDPVLSYETFLASTPLATFGVATDLAGSTYISGIVETPNGGIGPLAILKVNPAGTGLLYASYFGNSEVAGSSLQPRGGIVVDPNGNAIVAVWTLTTNLPLKNPVAPAPTGNGAECEYVLSLSPDGSAINYASLLGGYMTFVAGVAVDAVGNAYVTGTTDSPVYPVTPGALNNNATPPGSNAYMFVYVTKFLSNGTLGYSAVLGNAMSQAGGSGLNSSSAIATDLAGNTYITGAAGVLWPVTSGAYQKQIPGIFPTTAPFVTKLSADGSTLLYSTFLGTQAQPVGISVNSTGKALVTGWGAPSTFPVTANAYQTSVPTLESPSFLSELSADGSQLLYSAFLGGQNGAGTFTSVSSMSADASGGVWLAGTTTNSGLPMVDPLQAVPATSPLHPGFLTHFDSSFASLTFSTFVGDLTEGGQNLSIAADANGRLHLAGGSGYAMYTTPNASISSVPAPPPNNFYVYGFSAVVDPSVQAPAICLPITAPNATPGSNSPTALNIGVSFGKVVVNTTSTVGLVITNCGELPLQITGSHSSDPAYSAPIGSSALNTGFPDFGGRMLIIAWALLSCSLFLTWRVRGRCNWWPVFSLTLLLAAILGCGKSSSTSQSVSDPPARPASTCQQAVPVSGSCTIEVSFTPAAQKSYPAILTVTSNAPMPVVLPLSGIGQ